jgi:F-box and leucine-rich repeat protein 2/20
MTSLTCSHLATLHSTDLFFIDDCFPLLEELNLSDPREFNYHNSLHDGVEAISLSLLKLRKVNLSRHHYINDQSLFHLINKCKLLEEVIVFSCHRITISCIASACRKRPTLTVSISITSEPDDYAISM